MVSQCLKTDHHLSATLENSLLDSGLCPALASQCLWQHLSDPTLDSPGRMKHPTLTRRIALRSSFLIPNMLTSISTPQVLLRSFFPELSSTWCPTFLIERKWLQENIKKFTMLNTRRRWFHSSRVKLPSVNMSASWFIVSTYLILMLGSKLTLSHNQPGATLWVVGHVSHRRTSALYDHFDHRFSILENIRLSFTLRRACVCDNVIHFRQFINISVTASLKFCFGF